jgi:decaprenylphospho-beta-D-ribofuranose 2-oxidase
MSVADRHVPIPARTAVRAGHDSAPGGRVRRLSGWGRAAYSRSKVITVQSTGEVSDVLADMAIRSGGVIARGAGRSYGDAAQNAGGTVLDLTALDRVLAIDAPQQLVRVQAGVTYARLLDELVPRGFTLPVIPGTRHVTVGGGIASDVHGKNHPRDGSLARHLVSFTICTPADGCREVSAKTDRELFLATLGGMGLLGIVVEATLAIEPLRTPWWTVDTDRTDSLDDTLSLMERDDGHRFSVAWLDLLARGSKLGRAVVTRSNEWTAHAVGRRVPLVCDDAGDHRELTARPRVQVPPGFPGALLAPPLIGAFNALRWHAFPRRARGRRTSLAPHFFPLDGFANWNRLYGSRGLLQYQFAVPDAERDTLVRCVEVLRERRVPTFLAVLKRLGPGSGAPLSFPIAGWTLALDIPAAATGLRPSLDAVDELVANAGGRVYLTKDLRLRRDLLSAMYPELERFRAQHALVDPDGVLRSDLGCRLGLCRTGS